MEELARDFRLEFAIATICAWLVPHIGIEIAEYRNAVSKSLCWKGLSQRKEAYAAITKAVFVSVGLSTLAFVGASIGIALHTQNMDWRAIDVLSGLSRITGGVVIFLISYKCPKWLGVYHSCKHRTRIAGDTVWRLQLRVGGSIGRYFAQNFVIASCFCCGAHIETIPVSLILGILVGFAVYLAIYLGRTKFRDHKKTLAWLMVIIISLCAAIAFSSGVYFIQRVWGSVEERPARIAMYSSFFLFLVLEVIVHAVLYHNTALKQREIELFPERSEKYKRQLLFSHSHSEDSSTNISSTNRTNSNHTHSTTLWLENNAKTFQVSFATEEKETTFSHPGEDEQDMEFALPKGTREPSSSNSNGEEIVEGEVPNGQEPKENDDKDKDSENQTTRGSKRTRICCGKTEKSFLDIFVSFAKWTISIGGNGLYLYLIIVNIGATKQIEAVNKNLQPAFDFLYPPGFNEGEVCAWDAPSPNSTITTFPTPEAATDAGFEIVHCGACGACSNWNDLKLQWTSRNYLAATAQTCVKRSLFGGGFSAAQDCNENLIGFTEDCATCWTVDQLCAKKHCLFIFLQGVLTNKLTNFEVGPGEITSATCDEAMCGPEFVPCSGANRRRMNIKSSIERPPDQQCQIVDQDWENVF